MRTSLCLVVPLVLPALGWADIHTGTVVILRSPSLKDPGLLVVKDVSISSSKKTGNVVLVRELEFSFAPHLAEGKQRPNATEAYRKAYPHMPIDLKVGDSVEVEYKEVERRNVIRGIKRYEVVKKKGKGKK